MEKEKVKQLLPQYIEKELQPHIYQQVTDAIRVDSELQEEEKLLRDSWSMLSDTDEITPSADYISRFWTSVSTQQSFAQKLGMVFKEYFLSRKLVPIWVGACAVIIIFSLFIKQDPIKNSLNQNIAYLSIEDVQLIEDLDLIENYELIEDLEFLQDMEEIEEIKVLELSFAV